MMIKIILLFVYLMGGELKVEQQSFNKMEDCQIAGAKRAEELVNHPKFEQGFFAGCVEARVQEATR